MKRPKTPNRQHSSKAEGGWGGRGVGEKEEREREGTHYLISRLAIELQ